MTFKLTGAASPRLLWRADRAEARNTLACAMARSCWHGFQAQWRWVAGGYAIFAGHWTHLTQAVGVGVSGPVRTRDVDLLNRFFSSRQSPATAYVPEWRQQAVDMLLHRGYRRLGVYHVLGRSISSRDAADINREGAAIASTRETHAWIRATAQGFTGSDDVPEDLLEIGGTVAFMPAATRFLVRDGSAVCGTAAVADYSGVALLFADSTRAQFRGCGVQSALINARLSHASTIGCDSAVALVEPGSGSERNYLRCGFRRLYSRVVLQFPFEQ